ncbi:MAG: hypothetical protein CL914_02130 [Deltaproteobacteria bacterium]|nr:hypothetical protein [Deltaproteobacteria bacterium]
MRIPPRFSVVMIMLIFLSASSPLWGVAPPSLQKRIDALPAGFTLRLEPGIHQGPLIIEKALALDGQGEAIIDGGGQGSVIQILADGVTIQGLSIIHSGSSHDSIDAGISVKSSHNILRNNIIRDTLFGIDLKESHENLIEGNEISSKPVELGMRGDGIRAWASNNNYFRKNKIHDSRDMIIWYSYNNRIEDNQGWNNRYSLHFMYTGANTVRRNRYWDNMVGIFLMYSKDSLIEENHILHSIGPSGMGIGMKEVDNMQILKNKIVYCNAGIYLDQSPHDPLTFNLLLGNTLAFNVQGFVFHSSLKQNVIKGNTMLANLEPVAVHAKGSAVENHWEGNFWSDYEGFDRDRNGYGDRSYQSRVYFEQLWMNDPWMKFFYGSPVISMLNLLAKIAPISKPRLLLTDPQPLFEKKESLRLSETNLAFEIPELDEEDLEDEEEWEEEDENEA